MFVSPHLGHPSWSKIAVVVLRALVGGGVESGLAILHFVWQLKYRCPANVSMQDLTPFPLRGYAFPPRVNFFKLKKRVFTRSTDL